MFLSRGLAIKSMACVLRLDNERSQNLEQTCFQISSPAWLRVWLKTKRELKIFRNAVATCVAGLHGAIDDGWQIEVVPMEGVCVCVGGGCRWHRATQ